ncbi:MAG: hypothetical protein NZM43_09715 [Saprospiraceae bacterium]|nr:hypothetical protein [Saprospiraceae bacterium]MDW8484592.1 hypothetical protein [Saprospiraceae bacterium]
MTYFAMNIVRDDSSLVYFTGKSLRRVRTDVILGSPSADCSGVGICRVMAHGEGERLKVACPYISAWLSVTQEGKLRFEFDKLALDGTILERHFSEMLFRVFEPYVIPYYLLSDKKKVAERTIWPGIYPVWDKGTYLVVEF